MGCSASRPSILPTKDRRNHPEEENLSYASPSSLVISNTFAISSSSPAVIPRALSLQTRLVHHPPSRKGDSHHLVSLTSTTYGSLLLIEPTNSKLEGNNQNLCDQLQSPPPKPTKKIPRTQIPADPDEFLSPDSVINTWELMYGLDDDLDSEEVKSFKVKSSLSDHSIQVTSKSTSFQHLGFDDSVKKLHDSFDSVRSKEIAVDKSFSLSKPLGNHLSEELLLANMDPIVVSSYRQALSSRQLGYGKESKIVRSVGSSPMNSSSLPTHKNGFHSSDTEPKIVLYFTSLRGIRKTYEDCCAVRMIFRGFQVPVDERDISMDSSYRKELQGVLKGKAMSLPQVFIRGKHVGGVEEIKQMNEAGELANILEGFPVKDPRLVCESCGDARFVPCLNCNGSRKVFDKQLRVCHDCNENGLIRCPGCRT